nr:MAG TPA: hypothetical protein [Caudoviricetes sp.]
MRYSQNTSWCCTSWSCVVVPCGDSMIHCLIVYVNKQFQQ